MEMIVRSFIVVSTLFTLSLMGCGDGAQTETVDSQSPPQIGGSAGAVPPAEPTKSEVSVKEDGDWQLYRNQQYSLTFRYPPIYTLRVREEDPSEPDRLLRIGLLSPDAVGSPLEDRIPPAFAVDVYGNAVRNSIEKWIEERLAPDKSRYSVSAVTIGGLPGLCVTDRAQLAPNIFYYAARAGYVYRFTPLGLHSEQILASVQFEP